MAGWLWMISSLFLRCLTAALCPLKLILTPPPLQMEEIPPCILQVSLLLINLHAMPKYVSMKINSLGISCDFESLDFCSFSVSGANKFKWTIKQGEEFESPEDGPQTDDEGNTNGHFAYVKSGKTDINEGFTTTIESEMIDAANHLIECFEFKAAFLKAGGVKSITVVQEDQETEDNPNELIEEIWFYTSEQVENNGWFAASMEVRAHSHNDVPQNYTVSLHKSIVNHIL